MRNLLTLCGSAQHSWRSVQCSTNMETYVIPKGSEASLGSSWWTILRRQCPQQGRTKCLIWCNTGHLPGVGKKPWVRATPYWSLLTHRVTNTQKQTNKCSCPWKWGDIWCLSSSSQWRKGLLEVVLPISCGQHQDLASRELQGLTSEHLCSWNPHGEALVWDTWRAKSRCQMQNLARKCRRLAMP